MRFTVMDAPLCPWECLLLAVAACTRPCRHQGGGPQQPSRSAGVLHPSRTVSMDVFYSHCLGQWAAESTLVAHSAGDPHFAVLRGATSPSARKGLSRFCLGVTPVNSRPMSSHNSDTCTINMRPVKVEGSNSAWIRSAALGDVPQTTSAGANLKARGPAPRRDPVHTNHMWYTPCFCTPLASK